MQAQSITTQPSEAQIKQTIQDIKQRLKDPRMNLAQNKRVKQGYEVAMNILVDDHRTQEEIEGDTVQARAIGSLAVDYLEGECSKEVLMSIGLK